MDKERELFGTSDDCRLGDLLPITAIVPQN